VESTVWYRIDQAPDRTIALAVQGAGFAPVIRVYAQRRSSIQELDCASGAAGAGASVAFAATRGNTYLWTPPAPGRWRARARFLGTLRASPSRSGYAYVLVARPIG
jgi:hypothetical protein